MRKPLIKFLTLVWGLFLLQTLPLFAQAKPVVIDKIIINNTVPEGPTRFFYGNTRPWVLRERLRIKEGQVFNNERAFDKKIADIRDQLNKVGSIQHNFKVTITNNLQADQSQERHVIVTIDIADSFNFIAYPSLSFASSEGVDVGVRFRHYNPFGFMEQWTGRVGFGVNEENRWGTDFSLEGGIPLYMLDQRWALSFGFFALIAPWYGSIDDTLEEEVPFNFNLGLSTFWDIPGYYLEGLGVFTGIAQGIDVIAQQNRLTEDYDPYVMYTSYSLYFVLPILEVPNWGTLTSTTGHTGRFTYRLEEQASDSRRGYRPVFSQYLGIGDIDLVGNMRKGVNLRFDASFMADPYRARNWGLWGENATFGKDEHAWRDSSLAVRATGYYPLHEFVATSARAAWVYYPFDTANSHDFGMHLRGIIDSRMRGDMLVFWNFDLMFKMWLGKLDFIGEVWLSLFYDGGLTRQPGSGMFGEPLHSLGVEFVYHPRFSRNVKVRVSFGEDVRSMFETGKIAGTVPGDTAKHYELYLGIDLHY